MISQLSYHRDVALDLQECLKRRPGVLSRGWAVQQTTVHSIHVPAGRGGGFLDVHGGRGLGVVMISALHALAEVLLNSR